MQWEEESRESRRKVWDDPQDKDLGDKQASDPMTKGGDTGVGQVQGQGEG